MNTTTAKPDLTARPDARQLARLGAWTALLQSVATLVLLPVIARGVSGRRAGIVLAWGAAEGVGGLARRRSAGGLARG
jgi:hypothetical protein